MKREFFTIRTKRFLVHEFARGEISLFSLLVFLMKHFSFCMNMQQVCHQQQPHCILFYTFKNVILKRIHAAHILYERTLMASQRCEKGSKGFAILL